MNIPQQFSTRCLAPVLICIAAGLAQAFEVQVTDANGVPLSGFRWAVNDAAGANAAPLAAGHAAGSSAQVDLPPGNYRVTVLADGNGALTCAPATNGQKSVTIAVPADPVCQARISTGFFAGRRPGKNISLLDHARAGGVAADSPEENRMVPAHLLDARVSAPDFDGAGALSRNRPGSAAGDRGRSAAWDENKYFYGDPRPPLALESLARAAGTLPIYGMQLYGNVRLALLADAGGEFIAASEAPPAAQPAAEKYLAGGAVHGPRRWRPAGSGGGVKIFPALAAGGAATVPGAGDAEVAPLARRPD